MELYTDTNADSANSESSSGQMFWGYVASIGLLAVLVVGFVADNVVFIVSSVLPEEEDEIDESTRRSLSEDTDVLGNGSSTVIPRIISKSICICGDSDV